MRTLIAQRAVTSSSSSWRRAVNPAKCCGPESKNHTNRAPVVYNVNGAGKIESAHRPPVCLLPGNPAATAAVDYPAPNYPGPAGIGGYYPVPVSPDMNEVASAPLGQTATSYSEVDPKWKPPGE